MGSSRFKSAPLFNRENDVRSHVSCARSALKLPAATSTAVKHTPLTETLSPTLISGRSFAQEILSRRFWPSVLTATTLPTSSMIPVNIFLKGVPHFSLFSRSGAFPPNEYQLSAVLIEDPLELIRDIRRVAMLNITTLHHVDQLTFAK